MTDSKRWLTMGSLLFIGILVYLLSPVLSPFLAAILLAYLIDPLVNRLQKLKVPRIIAVLFIFLFLILFFTVLLFFLLPMLEQQIQVLVSKLPQILSWIESTLLPWLSKLLGADHTINVDDLTGAITQNLQKTGNIAEKIVQKVTQSGAALFSLGFNLVLIPVVMFYLLRDWTKLMHGLHDLVPRRIEAVLIGLIKQCDEVLSAFLRGQLMVMIGLGIFYSIGLALVGLDVALLIGIVGGILSIVPYLGFIISIIAASIAALLQFHSWISVFYVLLALSVAQSIEAMVLTPLFVGDKIGLHPVAVIFAILAGGELFGFVGVLLALPVAAVIMVFIRYFHQRYVDSELYASRGKEGDTCPDN